MLMEVAVLTLFFLSLIIFDLNRHKTPQENFVYGLQLLDKTVLILNDAEIDIATPAITIKAIAQSLCSPIHQAHIHLTAALNVWEEENARQCEEVEILISSIGSLKGSVSENKAKMEKLKTQLSSLNKQINDNEQQLQEAQHSLSRARDTLEESKAQLRERIKQRNVVARRGIAAAVIAPVIGGIFGLVAAVAVAVISVTALDETVKAAQSSITSAKDNLNNCTNMLSKKREEKGNLCEKLSKEESESGRVEQHLKILEMQLQQLQITQRKSIELSEKLKRTCHIMTTVWGKSRVLNREARCAYCLEPLLMPLREIFTMLTPGEQRKIKGNTLLLSNDINFSAISLKLRTICSKADNSMMAILDEYT